MMIIETSKDVEIFNLYWDIEPCIVVPIWRDLEKHPMNNQLSFLYVRFRNQETDQGDEVMDFILPFNHNDCVNLHIDLTESKYEKYVWNKKGLLQTNLSLKNLHDIQADVFFTKNELPLLEPFTEVLTNFYSRMGLRDDLGQSIPIMKWGEVLRGFTNQFEPQLTLSFSDTWINKTMIPVLSHIEQNGISVDKEKFIDRWPDTSHHKHLKGNVIYTEYNPYTMTSRPSNRHGGINFSALNKKDGTREIFIPREGTQFVQFDYDAYHIRIIAKMIQFEIPHTSGHQWLADQYGCSYDESKGRTFRIIYGGVSDEDKKIPFFKQIDDYIQNSYKEAQKVGYITTLKGRKLYLDWIEDITPQKLFNYYLQASETELNVTIMQKLIMEHEDVVFYTYDSFLFEDDIHPNDERINKIQEILESYGFPVKMSVGTNYSKV